MIPDYDLDARALTSISTLRPDAERAARIRQRCRSILERRAQAGTSSGIRRTDAPTFAQAAARKALVGVYGILFVVYVLSLVLTTVRLQGMSR